MVLRNFGYFQSIVTQNLPFMTLIDAYLVNRTFLLRRIAQESIYFTLIRVPIDTTYFHSIFTKCLCTIKYKIQILNPMQWYTSIQILGVAYICMYDAILQFAWRRDATQDLLRNWLDSKKWYKVFFSATEFTWNQIWRVWDRLEHMELILDEWRYEIWFQKTWEK